MNAKSESAFTSRTPRALLRSRKETDLIRPDDRCRYKSDLPMPDTAQASGMRNHCGRNGAHLPSSLVSFSVVNIFRGGQRVKGARPFAHPCVSLCPLKLRARRRNVFVFA
jgi:hypothetical protein